MTVDESIARDGGSDHPLVEFDGVNKYFGEIHVLDDVDLAVETREVSVVIGPSGSGKSTLLRCVNRLEEIQSGEVRLDGEAVSAPTPTSTDSASGSGWCSSRSTSSRT